MTSTPPYVRSPTLLHFLALLTLTLTTLLVARPAAASRPSAPLKLSLQLPAESKVGQPIALEARLVPLVDVAELVILAEPGDAGGGLALNDKEVTLHGLTAGHEVAAELTLVMEEDGVRRLAVGIYAFDDVGEFLFQDQRSLWLDARGGLVLSSPDGAIGADIAWLERDAPTLSPQQLAARTDDIVGTRLGEGSQAPPSSQTAGFTLTSGTAFTTSKLQAAQVGSGAGGDQVTVTGRVRWTDRKGGLHDARFIRVEIWDAEYYGGPRLMGVTQTSADGRFELTVSNSDFGSDGIDVYVRAITESRIFRSEVGTTVAGAFRHYFIQSGSTDNVATGTTHSVGVMVAGNVRENEVAFGVVDGMVEAAVYAGRRNLSYGTGPTTGKHLRTFFPSTSGGSVSQYVIGQSIIHLQPHDAFDWDTLHHEFGHHISDLNKLATGGPGSGAKHGTNWELSATYGKALGTNLAMEEGFATYFAVSMQQVERTAVLGVPGAGDLEALGLQLETDRGHIGESNEASVAYILWDLYDTAADTGDAVALGDEAILAAMKGTTTLSALWNKLSQPKALAERVRHARIYMTHGVAPEPLAAHSDTDLAVGSRLVWSPRGSRTKGLELKRFRVVFADSGLKGVLHETAEFVPKAFQGDKRMVAITNADLVAIQAAAAKAGVAMTSVQWMVRGTSPVAPVTGSYLSPPLPLYQQVSKATFLPGYDEFPLDPPADWSPEAELEPSKLQPGGELVFAL